MGYPQWLKKIKIKKLTQGILDGKKHFDEFQSAEKESRKSYEFQMIILSYRIMYTVV